MWLIASMASITDWVLSYLFGLTKQLAYSLNPHHKRIVFCDADFDASSHKRRQAGTLKTTLTRCKSTSSHVAGGLQP